MSVQTDSTQATGCTAGDATLYAEVDHTVDCTIASHGPGAGSLAKTVALGELASQQPISCMIDLITGPDSDCGAIITREQRQAAFDAFTHVTGLTLPDPNVTFDMISNTQDQLLNINAFYIFFPTFLLSLLAIWLMVGVGWVIWPVGLFLSVLIFIILYGFSVLYRIQAQNFLLTQEQGLHDTALTNQANFQNSVALWPQGLFAVACAVTSTGGTAWTCNNAGDPADEMLIDSPVPRVRAGACGPCLGTLGTQAPATILRSPPPTQLPPPPAPLTDVTRQTIHQLRRRRAQ